MRVAQVVGDLQIGGAEKHFVSLINNMAADYRLAVLVSTNEAQPNLSGEVDPAVDLRRVAIRKRFAITGVWKLARLFREARCDVVQTHMFWPNLYGCIAARLAGVPVVITTEHGENHWKKPIHRWLERHIISRLANYRYCVSGAILAARRDLDKVPAKKLRVIANGTPVPDAPAQLWQNDVPVIGSVGRFVTQKDYLKFVDIIAELRRQGHEVTGCLVGDGPEMPVIKNRIAERALEKFVELPGMVTETEPWFRRFDIYAITSNQEGQPVSLLEAMSYGLPIVSTNVGAISATLESGQEGLVIPAQELSDLVQAIGRFLDDKKFANTCAANARQRIIRDFSIAAIAAQYEACFRDLLARRGRQ